jgi:hypothetical protein
MRVIAGRFRQDEQDKQDGRNKDLAEIRRLYPSAQWSVSWKKSIVRCQASLAAASS